MTVRAFAIGLVMLLVTAALFAYTDHGNELTLPTGGNHLPTVVLGIVIFMSLIVNPLLRLFSLAAGRKPPWQFAQGEILTIWCMLAAGLGVAAMGLMHYMLPLMVAPFYYVGQGSKWEMLFYKHIPDWLVPSKDPKSPIVTMFYEGARGNTDPWLAWAIPMFSYIAILLAVIFLACWGLATLIKLLSGGAERPEAQPVGDTVPLPAEQSLFRHPVTWVFTGVPLVACGLAAFHTLLPRFNLRYISPLFNPALNPNWTPSGLLNAQPWGAWVVPFFMWGIALVAFFILMFCIAAIVRKQWVEHERLSFPLAQIPLEISRAPEEGRFFNALFRNPLTWIGAGIPIGFYLLVIMTKFCPGFPFISSDNWQLHNLFYQMEGWQGFFGLSFIWIGVAFLLSTEVSLSLWLFFILANVQRITRYKLGYPGAEYDGKQQIGAYIAFAAIALWTMRHHLKDVLRKAFLGAKDVDDSSEGLSYRTAVFGLIGSCIVIIAWLALLGCPPHISLLFLAFAFVVLIVLSRLIAQCGLTFVQTSLANGPLSLVQDLVGDRAISPAGLTALTFHQGPLYGDPREVMLPTLLNNTKVAEKRLNMRKIFIAMIVAVILVYPVAYFTQVWGYYQYGTGPDSYASFHYPKSTSMERLAGAIENPKEPFNFGTSGKIDFAAAWVNLKHVFIGAGAFLLVFFLRSRFHWWFVHPVGILTAASYPMAQMWLMTFIGWSCKSLAQKYARGPMMAKVQRFFLGLIIGEAGMQVVGLALQLICNRKII